MAEYYSVNVCISGQSQGTVPVGTTYIPAFWATDAIGGGVTITKVDYVAANAVAAASAPQFALVTLGTDYAPNGTICAALASAAYTAGTARAGTVSTAWVDGGKCVAVAHYQTAANLSMGGVYCMIQYVLGR